MQKGASPPHQNFIMSSLCELKYQKAIKQATQPKNEHKSNKYKQAYDITKQTTKSKSLRNIYKIKHTAHQMHI